MGSSRMKTPLAIALAVAAGGFVSLHAADNTRNGSDRSAGRVEAVPSLAATVGPVAPTIVSPAAARGGRELAPRQTITFSNSPTVMTTWEEAGPNGPVSHFAISRDGVRIDQVATTENIVRLRYAQFDPLVELPAVPHVLRAGEGNELFLVQFVGTPLDEMRQEIRAMGGSIERFLTDNTHIVRMGAETREWVEMLPYVRWVGDFHPAYKLDELILAQVAFGDGGDARYSIEVLNRGMAQQQAIADLVGIMGGHVDTVTPDQFRMEVTVSFEQILEIARRNDVHFIDPWLGPGGTDMDLMRQVGGAVPILSGVNILGQGVRGEIFDTGIINAHQQWNGQVPLINGATATDSHGVACYGVNFATGTGNAQATGMMPMREQGIFSFYNQTSQFAGGPTRLSLNQAATNPAGQFRSVFQTSSVGSARVTTYTTISAEVDDYLWKVDYLSCQSQSNASGTRDSRPQAWAKNIVAVGGITHNETLNYNSHVWATGASVGPASDLRVKPELAHSFGQIFTTYSTSNTGYGQFGGTSGATPITCGHFGLLHQMWHEEIWDGFGGGSSVFASRPRSTTARAIMINTAHRYPVTQGNMTRNRIGWGAAHLGNAYNLREKTFIVNETELLTNAETVSYNINVEPNEPEFKATMIYIDPPGTVSAQQARINNLDLKVTSPSGVVYWGNNGMVPTAISGAGQTVGANYTVPGGSANTYDTIENVFVQNPEVGTWNVEIIAAQVVQDAVPSQPGTQASFALVVTGGTSGPPAAVRMQFPGGLPFLIDPNETYDVVVNIEEGAQAILPGSPTMYYRTGGAGSYETLPLTNIGGAQYKATLPGFPCGDSVQIYFSAQGVLGDTVYLPRNAPDVVYSTTAAQIVTEPLLETTFDAAWPTGWSATGLWHVTSTCAPGGSPCAQGPYAYYGRSSTCNYNLPTGANNGSLSAPQITLPAVPPGGDIVVTFCYALETENSPNFDRAELFVNGVTRPEWRLDDVPSTAGNWAQATIDLSEFAGETVNLSWRFNTVNSLANHFRGWHLNNVRVLARVVGCEDTCYANCDGSTSAPILNVDDFTCFINSFADAQSLPPQQQISSYANCDGSTSIPVLNVDDFTCFINAFAAGCP